MLLALAILLTLMPVTVFAEEIYHPDDIAIINEFIQNYHPTGMTEAPEDGSSVPDNWIDIVYWNDESPMRVRYLSIGDKGLTGTLNLSDLEKLEQLACYRNELTGLNLSDLPALESILCDDNNLTGTLDLTNLTNLYELTAPDNNLSYIDVSNLASFERLFCQNNDLTGFDASGTSLKYLDCRNNLLTELDLSGFGIFTYLNCSDNLLTSVKLNPAATYSSGIDVRNNYLANYSAVTGKDGIVWDNGLNYFTPQKGIYTVTYNANGGAGTMADGKAFQDLPFTLPANGFTAPAGKRFDTWAIGSADSATKVDPGETHTFTSDTAVFALWEDLPVPGT